ncbi:MAG: methyltransferase domain-containing protein [Minisyncoccia bacterium]
MFSDPTKIIEQSGIQAGMDIADFGSGSGFYSLAASKALVSTGRVYAIDAQKDLLTKMKNQAVKEGLYNIEVIWGDLEKIGGTKLRESSIDLIFICNVFFQIENKENVVKEALRILKTRGRIVFVDWADSFGGIGPHQKSVFKKDAAKAFFEKYGFSVEREISAGSHHYGFIIIKM